MITEDIKQKIQKEREEIIKLSKSIMKKEKELKRYDNKIRLKVYCDSIGSYILIRENHLKKAGFKEGDFHDLEFKDNQIILNKVLFKQ
jgi:hypothetical protein